MNALDEWPIGRIINYQIVNHRLNPQRMEYLSRIAFLFGAKSGCRVTDDANRLDFRWQLAPPPG